MVNHRIEQQRQFERLSQEIKSCLSCLILDTVTGDVGSEHELIKLLQGESLLPEQALGAGSLVLFHAHFIVMHCLYQLKQDFESSELGWLHISPMRIIFTRRQETRHTSDNANAHVLDGSESTALSSYYLDSNNFFKASEESVDQLLGEFWKKYERHTQVSDEQLYGALQLLKLDWPLELRALNKRYRQLAQQFHPDKGGDAQRFIELKEAYNTINQRL